MSAALLDQHSAAGVSAVRIPAGRAVAAWQVSAAGAAALPVSSPGGGVRAGASRQWSRPARLLRTAVLGVVLLAAIIGVLASVWSPTAAAGEGGEPVSTVTVVVDEGDSLWSLVSDRAYDRDPRIVLDEVRTLNGLSSGVVHPGQSLELPAR